MSLIIDNCSENCSHDPGEESSKCPCKLISEDEEMEGEEIETIKRLGEKNTPTSDSSPPHKRDRTVSFETNSEYFQNETPLMFSRSSSLSSLSSVEQCSIHDDYSSVVSDFSQRASGIVSPSELPDSPSQVISQEPRNKVLMNYTPDISPSNKHISVKVNIFDDTVTPFKEEGTPADYSRATSLSALTFDKEPVILNELKLPNGDEMCAATVGHDDLITIEDNIGDVANSVNDEDMDISVSKSKDFSGCCEVPNLSEEEEGDEDILAACISVGMQVCNKRYSSPVLKDECSQESGSKNNDLLVKTYKNIGQRLPQLMMASNNNWSGVCGDALLSYNTEGTPSNLSHACSQSDLSVLSFPCDGIQPGTHSTSTEIARAMRQIQDTDKDFDDCVSNESEDCEDMLAECIRSGMPKPRKSP